MKRFITAGVIYLSVAAAGFVSASEIQVTFTNGAVRTLPSLRIEGGFLQLTEGRVDLPKISSVRFVMGTLPEDQIEAAFPEGLDRESFGVLKEMQPSLLAAAGLKGNAGVWLQALLRAYFWQGDYASAEELIQAPGAAGILPASPVYEALIRIGQNRPDESERLLASLDLPDGRPVTAYVHAQAAFAQEQYKEALQHLAQVALAGSRDSEWTPASIWLEGLIYKKTGQDEAAAYAARELTERYPGGYWSRRAEELK